MSNTAPDSAGPTAITRRAAAAAMVTIAGAAAACSQYGNPTSQPTTGGAGTESESESEPEPGNGTGNSGGGTALGKTADVPVGGGRIFSNEQVVVTQPTAGTFKGFSAICTHQGCTVVSVADGTINCPCHGSKFKIADGSVAKGPANAPLQQRSVTVTGDQITMT